MRPLDFSGERSGYRLLPIFIQHESSKPFTPLNTSIWFDAVHKNLQGVFSHNTTIGTSGPFGVIYVYSSLTTIRSARNPPDAGSAPHVFVTPSASPFFSLAHLKNQVLNHQLFGPLASLHTLLRRLPRSHEPIVGNPAPTISVPYLVAQEFSLITPPPLQLGVNFDAKPTIPQW